MNGLTLLALLALAIGIVVAWRIGVASGRRSERAQAGGALRPAVTAAVTAPRTASMPAHAATSEAAPTPASASTLASPTVPGSVGPTATSASAPLAARPSPTASPLDGERARLLRSLARENAQLRRALDDAAADRAQLTDLARDRERLFGALAAARSDTARYRTLVIDLENNAPPPLLAAASAPDDLKLIVGIGPVLERMLQQMGITSYRQIARWTERDIDEFDARLTEFPGRIRRDAWVTQARALHQSKYGESLPVRDR